MLDKLASLPGLGYLAGLVAVGAVTALIDPLLSATGIDNAFMLYLMAVLVTAAAFGSGPAVFASVAAVLTFEWFFVEPIHTFDFTSTGQYLEFMLLLLTATITGQLAGSLRRRAWEMQQREREAVLLYSLLRVMGDEPVLDRALKAVAEKLKEELQLSAVTIELTGTAAERVCVEAGEPEACLCAPSIAGVSSKLMSGNGGMGDTGHQGERRWIRVVPPHRSRSVPRELEERLHQVPISGRKGRVGTIYLVRAPGSGRLEDREERLFSAIATQVSLALERSALRQEATEAEILRRADELKTALLNAVSHELRTPLASIVASAGSLLEKDVDWSDQERGEFAESIEQEALRLNRLVGNLLDLSRLQGGSLRPQKGWYDLGALVDDVLGRLRNTTSRPRSTTC